MKFINNIFWNIILYKCRIIEKILNWILMFFLFVKKLIDGFICICYNMMGMENV